MAGCQSCGGAPRSGLPVRTETRTKSDPTAAMFASAASAARYMVKRHSGDSNGKRFGTLVAAQDYARRTGGIISQL